MLKGMQHRFLTSRFTRRELLFVLGGVLFVLCFISYQLVIGPFLSHKAQLKRSLEKKKSAMIEMQLLQSEYQQLKENRTDILARVKRRNADFNLFTFVEQRAAAVRVKDRLTSMKPSTGQWQEGIRQSEVEIRVEQIVLSQLVDFLVEIESFENGVFVRRIVVQKNTREPGLLDVLLTIITFEIEP